MTEYSDDPPAPIHHPSLLPYTPLTQDNESQPSAAADCEVAVDAPDETIISVDPGRAKCGVAVVCGPATITRKHRQVVATDRLVVEIGVLLRRFPEIRTIIIGAGTGSAPLRKAVKSTFSNQMVITVDEHRSSERGRERFLKENVPAGWKRIIPPSLRTPEVAYDDYVAIILAEEYFAKKMGNILSKP